MKTTKPKSLLEQMENEFVSETQAVFDLPIEEDDSDFRSMREWQIDREIGQCLKPKK